MVKVGKRPVNMSIDWVGGSILVLTGQYWLIGQLKYRTSDRSL